MEQLSDEQLLHLERGVRRWQRTAKQTEPLRPSPEEREQLDVSLKQLEARFAQLDRQREKERQELDTLGPARSPIYWFGSPKAEVKAAQARLELTQTEIDRVKAEWKQVNAELSQWQAQEETYQTWASHPPYARMLEAERDIGLPPVQVRLTAIHRDIERRAQQQRELNHQARWLEVARILQKPERYLNRIGEVTTEVEAGQSLSEAARQTRREDLRVYCERLSAEPGTVKEVNRILSAVYKYLKRYGQQYTNGTFYEGKRWELEATNDSVTVIAQKDRCVLLRVKNNKIERYQALPQEREELRLFCQQVEQMRQVQKQRGFGLSR